MRSNPASLWTSVQAAAQLHWPSVLKRSTAHVIGIDTSEACIEVARANAVRLDIDNVELREGHLLESLDIQADVIVSNPPYVANDDPALLGDGVRLNLPRAMWRR